MLSSSTGYHLLLSPKNINSIYRSRYKSDKMMQSPDISIK